jgi:hypothetical protein
MHLLAQADARRIPLPDQSVHRVVTCIDLRLHALV